MIAEWLTIANAFCTGLRRTGDWNRYLQLSRAALMKCPNEPLPVQLHAVGLVCSGAPSEAVALVDDVVRDRPDWNYIRAALADALHKTGERALHQDVTQRYLHLAMTKARRGQPEERVRIVCSTLADFVAIGERQLQRFPDDWFTLTLLSHSAVEWEQFDQALAFARRAVAVSPNPAGIIEQRLHGLVPRFPDSLPELVAAGGALCAEPGAARRFAAYLGANNDGGSSLLVAGDASYRLREFALVPPALEAFLALQPDLIAWWNWIHSELLHAYCELRQFDDAIELVESTWHRQRMGDIDRHRYAAALTNVRRYADAEVVLTDVITRTTQHYGSLLLRAHVRSFTGKFAAAADDYSACLVLHPTDFVAIIGHAVARAHAGDRDRAKEELFSAAATHMEDPAMYRSVIMHLARLGETLAAVNALGQAKARDPHFALDANSAAKLVALVDRGRSRAARAGIRTLLGLPPAGRGDGSTQDAS